MKYVILACLALCACEGSGEPTPQPVQQPVVAQQQQAPQIQAAAKRLVFIGDSITARWPTAMHMRKTINSGVGGDTTCQARDRFYDDVLVYSPTHVIIQAGINDLNKLGHASTDCVFDMVVQAQRIGAHVIVGTLLPFDDFGSVSSCYIKDVSQGRQAIRDYNAQIKSGAAVYGYKVVDYYPHFLNSDGSQNAGYFIDNVHPNPAAYQRMTEELVLVLFTTGWISP